MTKRLVLVLLVSFTLSKLAWSQSDYTLTNSLTATSVKDQQHTGTCWCFATTSLLESEALRQGKGEFDLSEMYFVRQCYRKKAENFIRFHGKANFSEGGQAHDVEWVVRNYGIVPNDAYVGLTKGETEYNHSDFETRLQSYLTSLIADEETRIPFDYLQKVDSFLDDKLGPIPTNFQYQGKEYTPITFAKEVVGHNPDDYVELTSFTHVPFYEKTMLEIPDNWMHGEYYNLPINELMQVVDNALKTGYSVDWDGDVSEPTFLHEDGFAALPYEATKSEVMKDMQQKRQNSFDNWTTTDDHLMHITGLAKNKKGNTYYYTKNSWNTKSNKIGGYLYLSEGYVQLKTVAIMVNKSAIPSALLAKLKL